MKRVKENLGLLFLFFIICGSYAFINFGHKHILNRNEFALDPNNTTRQEKFGGVLIAANKWQEIKSIVANLKKQQCSNKSILWLGNSQQHVINDYKEGDRLSVVWLADFLAPFGFKAGCVIGLSLPSINPKEVLYFLEYFEDQNISFANIIIPLEYNGYRQSGVRSDMKTNLRKNNQAKQINEAPNHNIELEVPLILQNLVEPSLLKDINSSLDQNLTNIFPAWNDRLDIQSTFIMYLFILRNKIFNISSTTKRNAIPERLASNIDTLRLIVDFNLSKNINSFFYFVPIRPNEEFPYYESEFQTWKKKLENILQGNDIQYADFTSIVEEKYWGSNFGEDIDFMHFGQKGHEILADAVFKKMAIID